MSVPPLTRLRRAARSLLLRGLVRAAARLPLRAGLAIGSAAGWLGWRVAGRTRRQILANLALAFPDLPAAERVAIGRACLTHLAWLVAESVTSRSFDAHLEDYVSFAPGAEPLLRALMAEGRGLVMV